MNLGNFQVKQMSNRDKKDTPASTDTVRDTLQRHPVPTEGEIKESFYRHNEEHGYAIPKEVVDD